MAAAPLAAHGSPGVAVAMPGALGPERELWRGHPSAKALLGTIIGAALIAIVLPAAVTLLFRPGLALLGSLSKDLGAVLARQEGNIRTAVTIVLGALVLWQIARVGWRMAVLKSHDYRVTTQRILIESGVFSKRIEEVDMRTVEDFKLHQSLIERLLRIGDVQVVATDRTQPELTLIGIPDPRSLREVIRGSAYQATRGQLFTRDV